VLDENNRHAGIVAELDLLNRLVEDPGGLDAAVGDLAEGDYATVTPQTRLALLKTIFNDAKVVLVIDNDRLLGVLTKIDLIDYLANAHAS
jgi:cystathionine beta-synthase